APGRNARTPRVSRQLLPDLSLLLKGASMDDQLRMGFEFARDFGEQLIALATGFIAFSVTLTQIFADRRSRPQSFKTSIVLVTGWLLFLLSIGSGLLHLMKLTGELVPIGPHEALTAIDERARSCAVAQVSFFVAATFAIVVYGFMLLWSLRPRKSG